MEKMIHIPVLFHEAMEHMAPKEGKIIIDATLGRAGHARGFLDREAAVIGFDQDLDAINSVKETFGLVQIHDNPLIYKNNNFTVVHDNFKNLAPALDLLGIKAVQGVFFDLGVSSPQFDDSERGFSYRFDTELDMRMDQTQELSAWDIVNSYDVETLSKIIREYGEERFARRIAASIVRNRPVDTTGQLTEIIKQAMPKKAREDQHPAKRTFQALRIAVNDELGALEKGLNSALEVLDTGGRLGVISFHSLEDRLVKNFFKAQEDPCICPRDLPICACGKTPKLQIITKRPIQPSSEEIKLNRRSRSARMRIAERITTREVGEW